MRHHPTPLRVVIALVLTAPIWLSAAPRAQDGVQTPGAEDLAAELEAVRQSITVSEERAEELTRQIEAMGDDRAQLNAELIAAAQRVKLTEIEVDDAEERLVGLRTEEARIRSRLESENRGITSLVASLQRIGRSPPPALIVDPGDALGSARSAMLISAVLPQLRERAAQVRTDLDAFNEVKQAALDQEALLRVNLSTLTEERLRIATLIEARKRGAERATEALEAEQQRAEELAARAQSLGQLIEVMETEVDSVSAAAEAARAADADAADAPTLPDPIRTAFADVGRTEPAIPFPRASGYLTLPTSGVRVLDFGAADGFGGTSQGISIVTRAEAQVVAPADGWVVYAGPYLNYGQILIFNVGGGYNVVLAGLEATSVQLGQFVLMGEPVGQMGTKTIGQTVATGAGMSRPTLYIEFRDNGSPVDPARWWASAPTETLKG